MSTWRGAGQSPGERDPRPVGESLDRVTRSWGTPRSAVLATVFSRWESIVGPEIAAHATPRTLRDGVLVIVADQPAWAAQLGYLASDLLGRLNAAAGEGAIAEVQVRVGAGGPADRSGRRSGRGR